MSLLTGVAARSAKVIMLAAPKCSAILGPMPSIFVSLSGPACFLGAAFAAGVAAAVVAVSYTHLTLPTTPYV